MPQTIVAARRKKPIPDAVTTRASRSGANTAHLNSAMLHRRNIWQDSMLCWQSCQPVRASLRPILALAKHAAEVCMIRRPPNRSLRRPAHAVVMLAYDDAQILDVTGPLEVFSRTSRWLADEGHREQPAYTVEVVAMRKGPLRTSSGLELMVRRTLDDVHSADTLLITGGVGFAAASRNEPLLAHIRRLARTAKRVGSICNGAVVLAATGLLKGREATTHWAFCDELGAAEPTARVENDAIYVKSGKVYTSAGVTAGMDMTLAMVEEDWGRSVAIAVAQQLVMFLKRPGGQSQFSRLLAAQAHEGGRFEELLTWIQEHPDADLDVASLAHRAHMSPRNFARRFRAECAVTPAVFVSGVRVEAARRLLEDATLSLKDVARRSGFDDEQALRRNFRVSTGILPIDYRRRFATGD
jgi:transcriptional regulator GlxA family with amidase domain